MARQEQWRDRPAAPTPDLPDVVAGQARAQNLDALLDEIDEVLETNAEVFVRNFVQKGGQ
jgi:ubiquitin-like protein Pup